MVESLPQQLKQLASLNVGKTIFAEPLAHHTSWKIGGPVDLFIEPEAVEQVVQVVNFTRQRAIPLVIIGQGSNLLFGDAGVRGVVLKIGARMAAVQISGNTITAAAGIWVPQLARLVQQAGLSGLEHCIGIPGTVGGLVLMNGGSQRKGIGENVVTVTVVTRAGQVQQLSQADCQFSYRQSALQGSGAVVVAVELHCQTGEISQIRQEMLADLRTRRGKFPRKLPNCGSVFLSTAEMHASVGPPGKIIEMAGLKGLRCGAAEVSSQHANFIVNLGGAKAVDVLQVIKAIRNKIRLQVNFELDCEVRYVSSDGKIYPAHIQADKLI
ncbi:MAG: UDP-N-acetylmuramate dehydrogenase [Desulfuromonadales bacterium]|nr:UDP-N-acetylmuramate dehydrogenase [Desulfuromonadales bacterium]